MWTQNWTLYVRCSLRCAKQRGGNNFHAVSALAVAVNDAVGLHHHQSTLLAHYTSLSSRPPWPFSAKLLPVWAMPVHLHELCHPRWRTLHCLCQVSSHFCQAIPSSLSGSPKVAAWPPQCSDCSHQFNVIIDTDLLRVTSFLKFRLLKERTSANDRGMLLITSHQLDFQLLTALGDQQSR